jgi:uncharacterized protein (DUF952 family)
MRIFHITTPEAWAAAQQAGCYTTSTRGRTLAEEGYIHCSQRDQVQWIRGRYFGDLDDLVLLEIDTDRLTSPWHTEQLAGANEPYPHVYGPVDLAAVVDVRPLS